MVFRRRFLWITALLLAALGIRLAAAQWWQSRLPEKRAFAFADSESYWSLARTIAHGETYQFGGPDARIFRTPGYPALLTPVFLWGGDAPAPLTARYWGALWGVVAVALCGWLAWELAPPDQQIQAALFAMLLTAIYPGAIVMSVLVLSEVGFVPWMLAQLLAWARLTRDRSSASTEAGLALAAGLCAAIATLMRPSWLLFTPLLGAAYVACEGPQRRRRAIQVAVMMLGLAIGMTPWWIRNYRLTGLWIPTTLQVGASLYDGLNPHATGASDMRFVPQFAQAQRRWDQQHPDEADASLYERRLDESMKRASIDWARTHPGRVAELAWIKFRRMWNPLPNDDQLAGPWTRAAIALGYTPLLIGMLAAAWLWGRRRFAIALCLAPAAYFTLLHVVFVSSIRYRQPAMMPGAVLAALAMVHFASARAARRRAIARPR